MTGPGGDDEAGVVTARAVVRPDGSAEVRLAGVVQAFAAGNARRVAGDITEYLAERAAADDRPVRLDLQDPDGQWVLVVHPDGAVEELHGPTVRTRGRRAAPSPVADTDVPAARDHPAEVTGATDTDAAGPHAAVPDAAVPDAAVPDAAVPGAHVPGGTSAARAMVDGSLGPGEPQPRPRVPVVRPPTGAVPLREVAPAAAPRAEQRSPSVGPAPDDGAAGGDGAGLPTLGDLLATRPAPPSGPARLGWQGAVRRLTGGLVAPAPGRAEVAHRRAVESVQRTLGGPRTVVVVNPKGGAHKTTATLLVAATFGTHRGGYTLAWDNNETRGTLGWRSVHGRHSRTAVDLLRDLDRFADPGSPRVGDLDTYVRSQGSAQFDVLASDEDAASAASVDADAFRALHRTLARFYRVIVVDTGNNMRASNWQAAVSAADQLVIVSTVREDTAQSAAWAVDALRATGHEAAVRHAVTVLSAPSADVDEGLRARLHDHFGRLTRVVLDVPHDAALVSGGPLLLDALAPATREAWLQVTAAVADGLEASPASR